MCKTVATCVRQCVSTLQELNEKVVGTETELAQTVEKALRCFRTTENQFGSFVNRNKLVPNKLYRYIQKQIVLIQSSFSNIGSVSDDDLLFAINNLLSVQGLFGSIRIDYYEIIARVLQGFSACAKAKKCLEEFRAKSQGRIPARIGKKLLVKLEQLQASDIQDEDLLYEAVNRSLYSEQEDTKASAFHTGLEWDGETIGLFITFGTAILGVLVTLILSFCTTKWNILDNVNNEGGVDITLQFIDYLYGAIPATIGLIVFFVKRRYPNSGSAVSVIYKISPNSLNEIDRVLCDIFSGESQLNKRKYFQNRKTIKSNKDFARARKVVCYLDDLERYREVLRNSPTATYVSNNADRSKIEEETLKLIQKRASELHKFRVKRYFLTAVICIVVATALYFGLPYLFML